VLLKIKSERTILRATIKDIIFLDGIVLSDKEFTYRTAGLLSFR